MLVQTVVRHGGGRGVGQGQAGGGALLHGVLAVQVTAQGADLVPQDPAQMDISQHKPHTVSVRLKAKLTP